MSKYPSVKPECYKQCSESSAYHSKDYSTNLGSCPKNLCIQEQNLTNLMKATNITQTCNQTINETKTTTATTTGTTTIGTGTGTGTTTSTTGRTYLSYNYTDYPNQNDIKEVTGLLPVLKVTCDNTPNCTGFNYSNGKGWLKSIGNNATPSYNPDVTFYYTGIKPQSATLPTYTPSGNWWNRPYIPPTTPQPPPPPPSTELPTNSIITTKQSTNIQYENEYILYSFILFIVCILSFIFIYTSKPNTNPPIKKNS
jgi:hypothetical protein